jgi:hypothetical protein
MANKKHLEILEKEDPRFYAIDKFKTGVVSIATTEKIEGEKLSFGLPSSPGLFLSLALNFKKQVDKINLTTCFDKHPYPQGTWPEDHKNLFDFFELMIGQIIFSYTAIETFSNIMIPNEYKFQFNRIDPKSTKEYDKEKIERTVSLDKKLDLILPEILSVSSPINRTELWGKFMLHKDLRDRLIHLKSVDMTASGPEINTIWGDLIRNHKTGFVILAHNIIGHFISNKSGFRWFTKFPYYQG